VITTAAYCLFYRRRDSVIPGEETEVSDTVEAQENVDPPTDNDSQENDNQSENGSAMEEDSATGTFCLCFLVELISAAGDQGPGSVMDIDP
jgi:hypothetical protein